MTETMDVKTYLDQKGYNVRDDRELVKVWADCKVNLNVSQNAFATGAGVTDNYNL